MAFKKNLLSIIFYVFIITYRLRWVKGDFKSNTDTTTHLTVKARMPTEELNSSLQSRRLRATSATGEVSVMLHWRSLDLRAQSALSAPRRTTSVTCCYKYVIFIVGVCPPRPSIYKERSMSCKISRIRLRFVITFWMSQFLLFRDKEKKYSFMSKCVTKRLGRCLRNCAHRFFGATPRLSLLMGKIAYSIKLFYKTYGPIHFILKIAL